MEVKPVDEVKTYDGLPLAARAVEGANPSDALLLRELLNAGYTYEAEFGGSRSAAERIPPFRGGYVRGRACGAGISKFNMRNFGFAPKNA